MTAAPHAGGALRELRATRRISQLELALRVGVSQRHLSCIETGRAAPSRAMLHALLDALEAPLAQRNDALLAAGYAPAFTRRALAEAAMAPIRDALTRLLHAHDPAPAFVLDDAWDILQMNRGSAALLGLLGLEPTLLGEQPNLLRALFTPGGLAERLINADEVLGEVWSRAQREAAASPALRAIVQLLRAVVPRRLGAALPAAASTPLLLTRLRARGGDELTFFSAFTSFGAPLDVTAASLRVEHFFPANDATRTALAAALDAAPATSA
ncbi:MAG TPA: helix-turn-helix transcriptional regulator [Burkholderiaceae bacterium]|nr:helix-turn-helix transcriptional regulator [Burkholderiaceae bacterium]